MNDHRSIDQVRGELGLITFENQSLYSDSFLKMPIRNEREALEWIQIFADDDYDDYGALAWDIVLSVERHVSMEGLSELANIRSYWAQIALHGVVSRLHSSESA